MTSLAFSKKQWPFAPQCINNCIFWLDAADQSSYTPGASITSFRNKGYAAGSTTSVTGTIGSTTADINGIPALAFSAASFTLGPTMTYTQTTRTAFLVVNIGASGSTRNFMIGGANSIDTKLVSINTDLELSNSTNINYSTTSPYPIFNTTSIICGTTLSTNPGIFVNGLAQTLAPGNTPVAYIAGATTQQQVGNNATATFVLGEAMIFDGAITDIQRQQVEGYLAQKWGLQSFLPPTHPYFTLNNLLTNAFTPTEIPTCTLWLDASDATSVVGTGVATWKDKSGNGNNATGVNAPVFVQRTGGVSFTAASAQYFTMGVTYSKTNTIFMVATPVPSNASGMYYTNTNPTNSGDNFIGGFSSSYLVYYIGTNSVQQTSYVSGVPTSPFIAAAVKTTGVSSVGYYNGEQVFSIVDNTSDVASTWAYLGAAASGANYLTATVYEFIIYNVALTANQVQAVNAYLGAKWNIAEAGQGSIAPVVNPLAISGCQLWLDGADQTSIVPVVSQWNDKSGNGYNLAVGSGTTTYVNYGPGPSIKLNSSYLFINKAVNLQSYTLFVVSLCQTAVNNQTLFASRPNAATTSYNATDALDLFLDSDVGNQRTRFYADAVPINNSIAATTIAQPLNLMSYTCTAAGVGSSWVNGVVGATASGAARGTTGQGFGLGADWETTVWGNIQCIANTYEIIVYNSVLTTTQRQQVENYLMAKWGVGRNFWIDASDATTITTGTTVTKWLDKSGNGNNVSQTTSSQCPVYTQNVVNGLSIVRFNYSNSTNLQTSSFTSLGTQGVTFFLVERNMSDSAGSGGGPFSFNSGPNSGIVMQNNSGLQPFTGIPFNSSTARIDCYYRQNTSGTGTSYTYVNGTSVVCQDTTTGTYGTTFAVGQRLVGNLYISGDICEIIIYAANLTTTQRQSVESYLGTKWGIPVAGQGSVAPVANPTAISGCQLWLDGADATTIVPVVSQWNDKSGNGYNLAVGSGTTTYVNYGPGPSIKLNSSYLFINKAVNLTQYTFFIVVLSQTAVNNQSVFTGRPNTSTSYGSLDGFGFYVDSTVPDIRFYFANNQITNNTASTTISQPLVLASYTCTSAGITNSWVNGVAGTSNTTGGLTRTSTAQGFALGGEWQGSSYGNIISIANTYEIIVYNSVLTTTQRQQVENYLMAKWGVGRNFWIDASDATTITTGTNGVSQINDKSGNGYNVTQSTATYQPTITNNYLSLGTASNYYMNMPQAAINNASSWTLFLVFNPSSSTNWIMVKQFDGTNTYNVLSMTNYTSTGGANTTGTTGVLYFRPYNAGTLFTGPAALTTSTNQLLTLICNGTNIYYYINGVLAAITNGTFTIQNQTGATNATLGAWISSGSLVNSGSTNFQLGELDFYRSALPTAQIQQIEAYLMNKWSITNTVQTANGSLVDTPFLPTDITGCAAWYDGADTSSITMTGTAITSWADKSGNSKTATAFNSPTYSISGLGVTMNGTNNYFTTTVTVSTSTHCLIAVHNPTTISGSSTGNTSLFRFQATYYIVFPYMNSTTPRGYISSQDSTTTAYNSSVLVENSVANTRNVIAANIAANSQTIYKNGVVQSTGAGALSNVTSDSLIIGSYSAAGSFYEFYSGTIYEMIVYNTTLTTAQFQAVTNYLQRKWNTALTVTTIPTPVYNRPFQPVDIAGCQLWLDSADNTALALSGSNVTTWYDKSGNGNNGTATGTPVLTANSINGYQSIYLADAPYFLGSVSISTSTLTCFAVATTNVTMPNSRGRDQRLVSLEYLTNVDYGRIDGTIALFNQATTSTIATWRVTGPLASNAITTSTPFIAVSQYNGANAFLWYTGTAGTSTGGGSTGNFGITKYGIGNQANPSGETWNGYIGEVIIYNTALSTSERQQVEAYLAWKWGFVTGTPSLPSTHPGKTLPSFSTIFTPKSISSLTLWLDGADPAGTGIAPANAASITTWVDKSGLGYNPTGGVAPTFATNSLNGLGTLTFNGTSQYLYASTFTVPTATHFMIAVHKPNSIGTAGTSGCDTGILRAQSSGASGGYIVFPYSSYGYYSSFNGPVILNNYDTAGAWNIYGVNVASGNTVQYQNGSLSSSTSASVTATTSDAFTIGAFSALGANPSQYYSGSMAEIIVCSNTVTTYQRQQIEGYLAWKWGVQSSLPTTHPFKKFSP